MYIWFSIATAWILMVWMILIIIINPDTISGSIPIMFMSMFMFMFVCVRIRRTEAHTRVRNFVRVTRTIFAMFSKHWSNDPRKSNPWPWLTSPILVPAPHSSNLANFRCRLFILILRIITIIVTANTNTNTNTSGRIGEFQHECFILVIKIPF